MKLTTKITLGIILGCFALSLLFIIGFSFSDLKEVSPKERNNLVIPDDRGTVERACGQFKEVVFEADKDGVKHSIESFNRLTIVADEQGTGALTMPAPISDFVVTETVGETLHIRLKTAEMVKRLGHPEIKTARISGIDIRLKVQNLHIVNKLYNVSMLINGITTDTIVVYSSADVVFNNCKADVFEQSEARNLKVHNCALGVWNIDLDRVSSWSVSDSSIGEENLYGSGKHHVSQHKSEAKTVRWFPKSEDAGLTVQLYGDTAVVRF